MKKPYCILTLFLSLLPVLSRAQDTVNPLEYDFDTRTSLVVHKELAEDFHLTAEYQLRSEHYFKKIDRHQLSFDFTYDFNKWLSAGLTYTLIERYGEEIGFEPRHRLALHATGALYAGAWRFSLTETLRATHKTREYNWNQQVRNPVELKSMIMAQYQGFKKLEPYAFAEFRLILNNPDFSAKYNASSKTYTDYQFLGYRFAYFNRYRGALGLIWNIAPQHALDFYCFVDYHYNREIDTNKAGNLLEEVSWSQILITTAGVKYTFSF